MLQNNQSQNRGKASRLSLTIKEIALMGMMVAMIEACKMALSFLPNIELTTFWLIMFTIYFGWRIVFVVPVFILIEMSMYGPQLWVIMYAYIWPLLVGLTFLFRKQESVWFFSIFSGLFGLFFGMLCAIPYVIIGAVGNSLQSGLYAGFTWWIAGIPWDITHCIGNFCLMLVLYKPVRMIMKKVKKYI